MLASCNKDEHQHSYTSSVTTPATCSNPGVETFTCSCGAAYTQIIPATNDHAWEKIKVYANSCESEGWTVYECSVCHEQKQDDWTPKLDHQYEAVETVEETCTKDGYQIMQCSYCGDRYTDDQYSSEHKATGHKWIVNTDPADPADLTDAEGWKVVSPADCLNAAQLQRTCSVCGDTEEKVGAPALGHHIAGMDSNSDGVDDLTLVEALAKLGPGDGYAADTVGALCNVNTTLIDAEGNKNYAFVCDRENCPVEVKVDARGNTEHFIKAVDHKMKLDTTNAAYDPATCETEGNDVFKCSVCQTVDADNKTDKLGHKYNTVQSNGTDDVVVCIEDKGINTKDKYLDFMKSTVGAVTFYENQADYAAKWDAAYADEDNAAAKGENGTFAISQVCLRCGAPTAALGHKYIIVKYAEGSFTEYEKDEDGALVDYSDEVTVTAMNCRYVQICSGCGDVAKRGNHQNVSEATCRSGGICPDCGRQVTAQLNHVYANINDFVGADGKVKGANDVFANTKIKHSDAYNAWKKLSATETWMVPVNGDCESKSTNVYVCVECLIDALDEKNEVVWNQATEMPTDVSVGDAIKPAAVKTNAYVITNEFSHDYQPVYFTLDAKDTTAENIPWEDTSCQVGFKTAYICSKCGDVFTNVPVANDPDTKPEEGEEKDESETNEAAANVAVRPTDKLPAVFTDANGFVIDSTKVEDGVDFQEEALEEALAAVVDNKGQHLLYVVEGYKETSGYVAPTCVAVGQVPFTCLHCGTIVVLSAGASDADQKDDVNNVQNTYDYADVNDDADELKAALGEKYAELVIAPEADVNDTNDITDLEAKDSDNHAGKILACGEHCDHKNINGVVDCGATGSDKSDHSAVTVTYQLKAGLKDYYSNYTVKIAVVGKEPKSDDPDLANDFNNYIEKFLDGTTVAKCGDNKYTAPFRTKWTKGSTGKYLVLVDEDDKAYQFIGDDGDTGVLHFYTEDGLTTAGKIPDIDATSIKVNSNDVYFISFETTGDLPVAAPVSASTPESLILAFKNEPDEVTTATGTKSVLTINVVKDIIVPADNNEPYTDLDGLMYSASKREDVDELVVNLNGNTLTSESNYTVRVNLPVTINGGAIKFAAKDAGATASTEPDIAVHGGATLTLNDVDITSTVHSAIVVYSGKAATTDPAAAAVAGGALVVKDSTITSAGRYGITTNAGFFVNGNKDSAGTVDYKTPAVSIKVTDSVISMNVGADFAAGTGSNMDNTALFINVPADVEVTGSTLTANRQAVVVRGGTLEMSDTTLNLVTGFTVSGKDDNLDYTVAGDSSKDSDKNKDWGAGNRVPYAVIAMGNDAGKTSAAYQYKTTVLLDGVTFNAPTGVSKVVIGSDFTSATLTKADFGYKPATATTPAVTPVMVYLNANNLLSGADIDYCTSWDAGTTQLVNCGDVTGIR